MSLDLASRIRNVTAVLGPTNTGKTHLAIERMLGHDSGLIGLPLRLLAREVYDKVAARAGVDNVALITGEEKIKPERPRYWVCTVEAMPRDRRRRFPRHRRGAARRRSRARPRLHRPPAACARPRTRRCCSARRPCARPSAISSPAPTSSRARASRSSTYAGEKKITRLPPRTALVAFSASEVYAIAELIRRQRGGAAVVLGALIPRTRNAQVALYQSGDVDFLVATDAIGMGLNLDVDHVAFAGDAQVRRPDPSRADAGRARADRRPRRPPHERWNVRRHWRGRAVRRRPHRSARDAQLRARASRCSGATAISTSPRSTGCATACARRRARAGSARARASPTT